MKIGNKKVKKTIAEDFNDEQTFYGVKKYGVDDQSIVDFMREHPNPNDKMVHDFAEKSGLEHEELEEKIYSLLTGLIKGEKEVSPEVDVTTEQVKEKIKGGKADGMKSEDFDSEQIKKGIKIEMEHTDDEELAREIAKDHLEEFPDYYDRLEKMEKQAKKDLGEVSSPTQEISPQEIEAMRNKKMKSSEEFKKSNWIPIDQVKLMIAQTLHQFQNQMSQETIDQLESVLNDKMEKKEIKESKKKGETKMKNKNLKETLTKVIKEFCKAKKINSLKEVFDFEKEQGAVVEQEDIEPETMESDESKELMIFVENDSDLYRRMYLPMIKNLVTKKAQGKYDSEKAIKLFMYLADAGAQKYVKEFGDRSLPWHKMFSKSDRFQVAKNLRDKFEQEVTDKAYDYDKMLPKKYQGTEIKEDETLTEAWNRKYQKVGQLLLKKSGLKGFFLLEEKEVDMGVATMTDEEIDKIYFQTMDTGIANV